jgi:hypothetical protein
MALRHRQKGNGDTLALPALDHELDQLSTKAVASCRRAGGEVRDVVHVRVGVGAKGLDFYLVEDILDLEMSARARLSFLSVTYLLIRGHEVWAVLDHLVDTSSVRALGVGASV